MLCHRVRIFHLWPGNIYFKQISHWWILKLFIEYDEDALSWRMLLAANLNAIKMWPGNHLVSRAFADLWCVFNDMNICHLETSVYWLHKQPLSRKFVAAPVILLSVSAVQQFLLSISSKVIGEITSWKCHFLLFALQPSIETFFLW